MPLRIPPPRRCTTTSNQLVGSRGITTTVTLSGSLRADAEARTDRSAVAAALPADKGAQIMALTWPVAP